MNARPRLRAVGDPAALAEQVNAEVERRLATSRARLKEFFLNYAELDRLAGNDDLAGEMEALADRVQIVDTAASSVLRRRARR